MAISREIQGLLAKEQFDSIEDHWLARASEAPEDLDYFVGVARALVGTGEEDRARFLLGMLDTELTGNARWAIRLKLLERAGGLLFSTPEEQHDAIVESLRGSYGTSPGFEGFLQAVRLDKAPQDLPKTWEKVERFLTLIPFDVGSVVWMEGKGAGRVTEVNLGLDSLKIDFEKHKGLTVGFRAAAKLLLPLATGHVLRRKMEDKASLVKLAETSPPELLRLVLESYGRPLGAGEVREALEGVVAESRWTTFWAAARKHPQVVADNKTRQAYSWLASSADAHENVWRRFDVAAPREKLSLYRKEGDRDPALGTRMAESLAELASSSVDGDPGLAFEIWFALERGARLPTDIDFAPEHLLGDVAEPLMVLRGIEDRATKERAYGLTRDLRSDWPAIFVGMLGREEDPKMLDLLAEILIAQSPIEFWRFVDGALGQPHKNPAGFTWVAERAQRDEAFRARNPLRLLQQLFAVLVDGRFTPLRPRLLPLLESGSTAPRTLAHLGPDHAAQAEEAIQRAAGLEGYQRDALTTALHLRFPVLRAVEDEVIYSTPEAIAARREELRVLVQEDLPQNRKAIEEARAMGDLRENFEYKSARQRHEYLSSRQAKLERELTLARPLDPARIDSAEVRIGTRVSLAAGDKERAITILGPWDSKPEQDILAYESEMAQGLLGKKVGEIVSVGGEKFEVRAIAPWR
jgi:transcription elongation GreA/GreB family factor